MTKQNICSTKFWILSCLQAKLLPWKFQTQQNSSNSSSELLTEEFGQQIPLLCLEGIARFRAKAALVSKWDCWDHQTHRRHLMEGSSSRSLAGCTVVNWQNTTACSPLSLKWWVCSCIILEKHWNWDILCHIISSNMSYFPWILRNFDFSLHPYLTVPALPSVLQYGNTVKCIVCPQRQSFPWAWDHHTMPVKIYFWQEQWRLKEHPSWWFL